LNLFQHRQSVKICVKQNADGCLLESAFAAVGNWRVISVQFKVVSLPGDGVLGLRMEVELETIEPFRAIPFVLDEFGAK
jgi:hypothetical protein